MSLSIMDNLMINYKEYIKDIGKVRRSLIYTYTEEYENNFNKYVEYLNNSDDNWLLIWCDFEGKNTYAWFMGETYELGYLVTSTNLVFKYLEDKR